MTGFGLLGHLREMAAASGLEAVIDAGRAPALPGALERAARGHAPGGAGRNRDFLAPWVDIDPAVPEPVRTLLVDPQTSGGLLLAVAPSGRDALLGALRAAGAGATEVGAAARRARRAHPGGPRGCPAGRIARCGSSDGSPCGRGPGASTW